MKNRIATLAALSLAGLPALCGLAEAQAASSLGTETSPDAIATPRVTPTSSSAPPAASAPIVNESAQNPVVVTAARTPQPLASTLPATTVFTRQDIDDSGALDLPSLLRLAPGAQVITNGGMGATASLQLRGGSAAQTLVLIDGMRVDSASLGYANLSQLTTGAIDHVEVVNGNVSALYGSGAIGGVVQIFTQDGGNHPPRFHFSTEYGSYRTQRQTVGVNGALDKDGATTFSLDFSRLKTGGFSNINAQEAARSYSLAKVNPNDNGFRDTTVSAEIRHRFTPDWDAGVRYFQTDGWNSYDNAYAASNTDEYYTISQVRSLSAFVNGRIGERWRTHLTVGEGSDHTTNYLNDNSTDVYDTANRQVNWRNEFEVAANHQLLFGYERLDQRLDSNAYQTPERHVNAGYLGYNGRIGASSLQLNFRHDQYSDFGGANTFFAGYALDLSPHWKVLANYSSAFRAPTFNDLYYPNYGVPTIQPERSHSIEAALQYSTPDFGEARVSLFRTRYRNLISYDSATFLATNVGNARIQGVETAWRGRLAATDVRASFTVQSPINEDTDQELDRRARRFATLSAARNISGWRVGGDWTINGQRPDGSQTLGGFSLFNVFARYNITPSWYIAARVQNVFDKNYELAYSYNTPGRAAYITLGWQQR